MTQLTVSADIQSAYDDQYTDASLEWRELGAKYKAQHIVELCRRQGIQPDRLLDVGAGEGSVLTVLDQLGLGRELYALEISKSGIEYIQKRAVPSLKDARQFDGYHIPYDEDEFDLVVLSHVLEHVEFPRLLLREIRRVSTYQVIEIPCDYTPTVDQKVEYFLSYGHINIYTPPLLRFLLKSEGFEIIDDLPSLTAREVAEYIRYNIQANPKTLVTATRLQLWLVKSRFTFALAGKAKKEHMAAAYTVLCKKGERILQIFG